MSVYRIVGGDVGTTIVFTVREWPIGQTPTPNTQAPVVDISGATNLRLILIPPAPVLAQGVSQLTVVVSLFSSGADGRLKYITVAGDVPAVPINGVPQIWRARAQFTLSGWAGKSEMDTFYVDP